MLPSYHRIFRRDYNTTNLLSILKIMPCHNDHLSEFIKNTTIQSDPKNSSDEKLHYHSLLSRFVRRSRVFPSINLNKHDSIVKGIILIIAYISRLVHSLFMWICIVRFLADSALYVLPCFSLHDLFVYMIVCPFVRLSVCLYIYVLVCGLSART